MTIHLLSTSVTTEELADEEALTLTLKALIGITLDEQAAQVVSLLFDDVPGKFFAP